MKRISTLLLSSALAAIAMAVPAKRQIATYTHINGNTVTACLMGDEHFHYYQDVNSGQLLFMSEDGRLYPPSSAELASRKQYAQTRSARAQQARSKTPGNASQFHHGQRIEFSREIDRTPFDLHGKRRALLMLVDFSDKPLSYTAEDFRAQVNDENYTGHSNYGSVHDYFLSQSYEQFDLTFDVVGPLQVSKKASYYGSNDIYGNDKYPATMVAEACELAHAEGINFADYDWDGDGEAEMVVCIYAGGGEAQDAGANTIWPHQWTLSEALEYGDGPGRFEIDGTYIDRYLVLNELNGNGKSAKLDGIGTFCHEYSHGLGLPDIYDTVNQYAASFGMDAWSLMDSGCYNGDGYVPCAYTAYERMYCGWLEPTELYYGCNIEGMKSITNAPEAYIIYNEKNRNEYYLLQNIQQNGWNEEAPGHGMLVMHVDYDPEIWDNNTVNNDKNHRCCTIVPADNNTYTSTSGLAGDPYPGSKKKTVLSDTSIPAATLYNRNVDNRKFLGKPIENIAESFGDDNNDGTISFTFNGGEVVGIANVNDDASTSTSIFDIYGRRTKGTIAPGIVITNGRARFVK